jgi:hypothetical protein
MSRKKEQINDSKHKLVKINIGTRLWISAIIGANNVRPRAKKLQMPHPVAEKRTGNTS